MNYRSLILFALTLMFSTSSIAQYYSFSFSENTCDIELIDNKNGSWFGYGKPGCGYWFESIKNQIPEHGTFMINIYSGLDSNLLIYKVQIENSKREGQEYQCEFECIKIRLSEFKDGVLNGPSFTISGHRLLDFSHYKDGEKVGDSHSFLYELENQAVLKEIYGSIVINRKGRITKRIVY